VGIGDTQHPAVKDAMHRALMKNEGRVVVLRYLNTNPIVNREL
jgi:hypothetical protein